MIVVVMGVSGCGKSLIGARLAASRGWDYQEGDALHPPANIAKMRAGTPLDDADRAPWLDRIAAWIGAERAAGRSAVVSCSALRRRYRDRLRAADPALRFAYLRVGREELARRMAAREHFMPLALLDSQLATLEEPASDEHAITVDAGAPADEVVARILAALAG